MNSGYLERVQKILSQIFCIPVERVLPGSHIQSLGQCDSHAFLFIVLAFEEEFNMEFEPEDMDKMITVEGIAAMIEERCE